jgi:hypothetical protein
MGLSCADNGNPPSTTSPAPPGPALDPEQALTGLLSDLTFYQVPYDSGWHTAVALTVRNQDTGPIEIKAAQFGDLENLVLGEPRIVGPQSPSLTLQILPGDPPRSPTASLPIPRFEAEDLSGYRIPPAIDDQKAPPFSIAEALLESDEENDASIVVPVRLIDPETSGSVVGVSVTYRTADGRTGELEYPDLEFGLCMQVEYDAQACERANR